jgi:ubiquinone/menaquinone biosynthesis C-methylase UbiE
MAYIKSQASREFNRWSVGYDQSVLQWLLFKPAHRSIISRLRARVDETPLTILDVGCGTGVFAARIAEEIPSAMIWGLDLAAGMLCGGLDRWRSLRGRARAVQGDSERLPFPDRAFDVVTCANSFHHYPDQKQAVAEMGRVLKPGGRLFLLDGCRDSAWGWLVYDVCVAAVEGDVHHAAASDVRKLLRGAGFTQISQKIYHRPAPFLLTEAAVSSAARPSSIQPWSSVGTTTTRMGVLSQ